MPSGYVTSEGVAWSADDLDDIFMARVNTKGADVNIDVGGVDISNRFEVIGAGTKVADVGYDSGGVDISNIFRDISEPLVTVTLSGGTVSDAGPSPGNAGIRVNSNGTIDERVGASYNQISSGTDWIIPNIASGDATYHFRVSGGSGDAFNVGSDAENTWINVSSAPEWWVTAIGSEVLRSRTFTLSVSDDGGSTTLTSNSYTVTADNDA